MRLLLAAMIMCWGVCCVGDISEAAPVPGEITTVVTHPGGIATSVGLDRVTSLAVDASDNVYFSDLNRVYKVDTQGILSLVAGTGTAGFSGDGGVATAAQINNPSGLAIDSVGNLYIADYYNDRIRKVDTNGIITTVVGTTAGFSGDGGAATAARINSPRGLAFDSLDNLYIADVLNYRIRKVDTNGIITTVAGTGTSGYTGDGGAATAAQIKFVYSLNFDSSGNLYIGDTSCIRKVDTNGIITTVVGTGVGGYSGDGGAATAAQIDFPLGMAFDSAGNLFIGDNASIRKVDTNGIITTVVGTGTFGYSGDGGAATAAKINAAYGLGFDSAGNLYLADYLNYRIRKVATNGIISTFAGGGTSAINSPSDIAIDFSGNLFLADNSNLILKIDVDGGLSSIAGKASGGSSADGIPAVDASLLNPHSSCFDASGNLYITSGNTIRKIDTNGLITTVAGTGTAGFSGDGGLATSAQLSNPWGVSVDSIGNIYIADRNNLRIRMVDTHGYISTVAGNGTQGNSGDGGPALAASIYAPIKVTADNHGNLYILVLNLSASGLRKVDSNGVITTPGLGAVDGVAFDSEGNLYYASGSNNRVYKVDQTSTVTTVAGSSGVGGYSGDGGPAPLAKLNYPQAVQFDPSGNLYIADYRNNVIRKVYKVAPISAALSYSPTGPYLTGTEVTITAAFSEPVADVPGVTIELSGANTLAPAAMTKIDDSHYSYTYTVGPGSGLVSVSLAGTDATGAAIGTTPYTGGSFEINPPQAPAAPVATAVTDDTVTAFTANWEPSADPTLKFYVLDVATDSAFSNIASRFNNMYVGNVTSFTLDGLLPGKTYYYRVRAYGAGGLSENSNTIIRSVSSTQLLPGTIFTIAGTGTIGSTGNDGPATAAQLYQPWGLALDGSGNLYIADSANHQIRKIDAGGTITNFAGTGTRGYSGDGGAATKATLQNPSNLAFDSAGNLYIADSVNHRIRKVDSNGKISTVAGTGTAGYSGDGGAAASTQINFPRGLVFDSAGNLYFADSGNHRIRKIDGTGTITTVAGTGTAGYSGDGGAATAAQINNPSGLAIDSVGNLYIADYDNRRVRKVDTNGIITTVAGTGISTFSGDGGPAIAAGIISPMDVYIDRTDNLYIATQGHNRIRKVDSSGIITTIAGTGTQGFSGDGGPATDARLYRPYSMIVDRLGNLFLADTLNNRIRYIFKVVPTAAAITFAPDGPYLPGSVVTMTATFTDSMAEAPAPTIALSGANTLAPTAMIKVDDTHYSYSYYVGPNEGTVSITLSGNDLGGYAIQTDPYRGGSFTVIPPIPPAPDAPVATAASNVLDSGFTANWQASSGATGYRLDVATDSGFSNFVNGYNDAEVGAVTSYAVAGLSSGTTYYYRVRATNTGGTSSNSNTISQQPLILLPGDITTFAGNGTAAYSGDGGTATSASLNQPWGVCADSLGNVYIADYLNDRVRKVDTNGIITTVAQLQSPAALAVDSDDNLYISDNFTIRMVDSNGVISTLVSDLNIPTGLSFDQFDNLYIADSGNNIILKRAPNGIVSTVAGTGSAGFSGDGGPATLATLNQPFGVSVDSSGNIYIADSNNHRIRKVDSNGFISTIAGTGNPVNSGDDGPATSAGLSYPWDLSVDGAGSLYLATANQIRKIDSNGIITTVAGNGPAAFSGDGGPAIDASLNFTNGVGLDKAGNLYIGDRYNNRIRKVLKVSPATASITYTPTFSVAGSYYPGSVISITATFHDVMQDAPVPTIALSGANTLAPVAMTKIDATHYSYLYTVGSGLGTVTVSLTGTDQFGLAIHPTPVSGASFTISQPASVQLSIQFGGSGSGSVTASASDYANTGCDKAIPGSCTATDYLPGTVVSLIATPDWKSSFASWTQVDSSAGATASVTMNTSKTVTATFDPIYTVKMMPSGVYYASVQDAYDNASGSGAAIMAQDQTFFESLLLNNASVTDITLDGGQNPTYSAPVGYTIFQGLTIRNGKVVVRNIKLKQ